MHQDFDFDSLRVDPATLVHKARKPKKWRRQYVRVPWAWVERLQAARRVSTYRLALVLVYESWRSGGRPIVLSNMLSKAEGLSRRSKWNALAELEALGLVRVKRRPRITTVGPPAPGSIMRTIVHTGMRTIVLMFAVHHENDRAHGVPFFHLFSL
jgi:hypothetical protein